MVAGDERANAQIYRATFALKGGNFVPIRWSPLKVSEAMNMLEDQVSKIIEPLESAKLIIEEARKIPNLPQYMTTELDSLRAEINEITGYTSPCGKHEFIAGSINRVIERVRRDLPKEAVEAEKTKASHGSQQTLV